MQIIRVETERIIASKDQQLLHSFCCKSISRDEWRLFAFLYRDREFIVMTLYQLLMWGVFLSFSREALSSSYGFLSFLFLVVKLSSSLIIMWSFLELFVFDCEAS